MKTAQNWGPWGRCLFRLGTAKNNGKSRLGTLGTVGTPFFHHFKNKNNAKSGKRLARDNI